MNHAVIDLQTGEVVARGNAPMTFTMSDGGTTIFSTVGQTEPAHAPRFKLIERVVLTNPPNFPAIVSLEESQVLNGREEIYRSYEPDQAAYQAAIMAALDAKAAERSYSNAVSLTSYVTSSNTVWKAEADAFVIWRDAVWVYALTELARVQAGERLPPSIDEILSELPQMVWPES